MSQAKTNTNPMAIIGPLTLGEKVALAAASLAIQRLPSDLQQASNAYDMQTMLVNPSSVGRGKYILGQAFHIFDSFSGFQPGAIDEGTLAPETREDFEKFIAEAIKAHEAEIAENEIFAASPEGKALRAKLAAKGLAV
jgi:hypothetical protein